jgi:hypothetical protein
VQGARQVLGKRSCYPLYSRRDIHISRIGLTHIEAKTRDNQLIQHDCRLRNQHAQQVDDLRVSCSIAFRRDDRYEHVYTSRALITTKASTLATLTLSLSDFHHNYNEASRSMWQHIFQSQSRVPVSQGHERLNDTSGTAGTSSRVTNFDIATKLSLSFNVRSKESFSIHALNAQRPNHPASSKSIPIKSWRKQETESKHKRNWNMSKNQV